MYEFFSDNATAVISLKDVEKWLIALGDITNKPALKDKDQVKAYASIFQDELGCNTGIEYMLMQEQDLVDAGLKKGTARLIMHYIQPQHTDDEAEGGEATASPASGQAMSALSGQTVAESVAATLSEALEKTAEQSRKTVKETTERKALKKLAGGAGEQMPKVADILKWVEGIEQDRANYSSEWAAGVKKLRKCPGVERTARVASAMMNVHAETDVSLKADIRKAVPSDVWEQAEAEKAKGAIEAIAMLTDLVVMKDTREIAAQLQALRISLPVAKWANQLSEKFKSFVASATEIRYSMLCTDDMMIEMMQHVLQRFQPLVIKIDRWFVQLQGLAATSEMELAGVVDTVIRKTWVEIGVLSANAVPMPTGDKPWGGRGKGKGNGKGNGKGGQPSGKGKGKGDQLSGKGKGGPKQPYDKTCWQWQSEGWCRHGTSCTFEHPDPPQARRTQVADNEWEQFQAWKSMQGQGSGTVQFCQSNLSVQSATVQLRFVVRGGE